MKLQAIIDQEAPLAEKGDKHDKAYAEGLRRAWNMCQGANEVELHQLREYYKDRAKVDGGTHISIAGCVVTAYLLGIIELR